MASRMMAKRPIVKKTYTGLADLEPVEKFLIAHRSELYTQFGKIRAESDMPFGDWEDFDLQQPNLRERLEAKAASIQFIEDMLMSLRTA